MCGWPVCCAVGRREGGRAGGKGRAGAKKSTVRTRAIKSQEEASQQASQDKMPFVPLSLCAERAFVCVGVCV